MIRNDVQNGGILSGIAGAGDVGVRVNRQVQEGCISCLC